MNFRIGFAIAKRLGLEGAKVMISSRKAANVEQTVKDLKNLGIDVAGQVCHVANKEDRQALFSKVCI